MALLVLAPLAAAQAPPICSTINPQAADFEIQYQGQTSGCTQALGSRPCVKGETIAFTTSSKYDAYGCPLIHTWTLGDSTPPLRARPAEHAYGAAGTYALSVEIITPVNQVTVAGAVTVVESVPMFRTAALVLLAGVLAALALSRVA